MPSVAVADFILQVVPSSSAPAEPSRITTSTDTHLRAAGHAAVSLGASACKAAASEAAATWEASGGSLAGTADALGSAAESAVERAEHELSAIASGDIASEFAAGEGIAEKCLVALLGKVAASPTGKVDIQSLKLQDFSPAEKVLCKYSAIGQVLVSVVSHGVAALPFGAPIAAMMGGIFARAAQVSARSLIIIPTPPSHHPFLPFVPPFTHTPDPGHSTCPLLALEQGILG